MTGATASQTLWHTLYGYQCKSCEAASKKRKRLEGIRERRKSKAVQWRRQVHKAIPPLFRNARLGQIARPLREKMLALALDRGLYLWGPVGTGKSYTLCALARHFAIGGCSVKRVKWDRLCLDIRSGYDGGGSESTVIEPLVSADKLILEDLGSSVSVGKRESDFAVRTLLMLLDERLEKCRATFISSNKPLEEIEKSFDQRIVSRLRAMCEVIKIAGTDKRISRNK